VKVSSLWVIDDHKVRAKVAKAGVFCDGQTDVLIDEVFSLPPALTASTCPSTWKPKQHVLSRKARRVHRKRSAVDCRPIILLSRHHRDWRFQQTSLLPLLLFDPKDFFLTTTTYS
jgi:hypothetical protein